VSAQDGFDWKRVPFEYVQGVVHHRSGSFLSITGLDFAVNNILYSYGLGFSYVWYAPYPVGFSVTIFSICFLVAWQSYEDTASMNVALKRGLTLFLAHLGGLIDWLFFLVYNGGRVYSGEWTWM